MIVTKRRVGAFATTELETVLRVRQVTMLVLLGIATSGAAARVRVRGYRVLLDGRDRVGGH